MTCLCRYTGVYWRNWETPWQFTWDRNYVTTNAVRFFVCAKCNVHVARATCLVLLRATLCPLLTEFLNKQTQKHANRSCIPLHWMGRHYNLRSFHTVHRSSKLNLVLFSQSQVWILDHPVMGHNGSCGYVRIACSLKMNLFINSGRNWIMVRFGFPYST